jgi:hypothetical protein
VISKAYVVDPRDADARGAMLGIAANYDRLAQYAEKLECVAEGKPSYLQ